MESRVEETKAQLARLQSVRFGEPTSLLYVDDSGGPATDTLGQSATEEEGDENGPKVYSDAQEKRINRQALAVKNFIAGIRGRGLLQLSHLKHAKEAQENCACTPAAQKAADQVVAETLYDAEVVRHTHSPLLISQRVSKDMGHRRNRHTIIAWFREFRDVVGYFYVDGRGKHERDWILNEDDLRLRLLTWLK